MWTAPDVDAARAIWADARSIIDSTLTDLLRDAHAQCVAYAPALPSGSRVPAGWDRAVVLQARENWQAALRDGDVIGVGDFAVRARPLSGAVKALLRPKTTPVIA